MPADHESAGSRAAMPNLSRSNSASCIAISKSDSRSHVYPHPPSPLHFTQLHYPKSTVFTPTPTPSRRHRHWSSSSSFSCCCFAALCSLLLTACTILGLAAFITWLVLRPISSPRYSIETVEFKSINVTSSSAALHADVYYTVTATNPYRRLRFRYDRMEFETSYLGHVFGRSAVAAFSQAHRNVSVLSSGFVVNRFLFTPESSRRKLASDWKRGRVALHLMGRAKVRVKVGVVTSMALNVRVDCDFVVAAPSGKVTYKVCSTR